MKILKTIGVVLIIGLLTLFSVKMIMTLPILQPEAKVATVTLKNFKVEEMRGYDGTDPNKPIYLAYEGNVYDVTSGKKFYQPGGVYHFITGKDATAELNIAGGGIIKRKYLIIGKIIK